MNLPKISIIVPVFNMELYLPMCIESILNQNYTNFELVLINDNSFDDSGLICDNYAIQDNRIVVIHNQVNQGSSLARRTGVQNASGDYITFADADDTIPPEGIAVLVSSAIKYNADITVGTMAYKYRNSQREKKYVPPVVGYIDNKIEYINQLLRAELPGTLWAKLYKRELFNESIQFPPYFRAEDLTIHIQLTLNATIIYYINEITYYWFISPKSIFYQMPQKLMLDFFKHKPYIIQMLNKKGLIGIDRSLSVFDLKDYIMGLSSGGYSYLQDKRKYYDDLYKKYKQDIKYWERFIYISFRGNRIFGEIGIIIINLLRKITDRLLYE
jgi:glycosyltransferase involved in cell wall biosynthesis